MKPLVLGGIYVLLRLPARKRIKKDEIWIVDLFKHDLVATSFMSPLTIRQKHDLMHYSFKLTSFSSSEKNRIQNCLTLSNIQLSNVVSDTFGKISMKIIDHLLENPSFIHLPFNFDWFILELTFNS